MSASKEQKLYEYIVHAPEDVLATRRNNPEKILDAFHQYIYDNGPVMIVGDRKGDYIVSNIKGKGIKTMAELGCYLGYSAVKFASTLPEDGKFYSFELNPEFIKYATDVVNLAGLSHKVEIIEGEAHKNLIELSKTKSLKPFDAVFIDHWKDRYVPDVRVLESLGLVAPGSVIFADNTLYPGTPEYLKYIRMSPEDKKKYIEENPNTDSEEYPGRSDIEWKNDSFKATFNLPPPYGDIEDAVEKSELVRYL